MIERNGALEQTPAAVGALERQVAASDLFEQPIIRGVLLPATMKLLGDWNWYLPRWLEGLPKVGGGRETHPAEGEAQPAEG